MFADYNGNTFRYSSKVQFRSYVPFYTKICTSLLLYFMSEPLPWRKMEEGRLEVGEGGKEITLYRVPNTFLESNSMIFPWFSMTLASFFHDRHARTMTDFNTDKTHYCASNVVSLHLLITTYNTHDKSCNNYKSLNNVLVLDRMHRRQNFFPWFFHIDILKFHDFCLFFKFHDFSRFSMIFQAVGNPAYIMALIPELAFQIESWTEATGREGNNSG